MSQTNISNRVRAKDIEKAIFQPKKTSLKSTHMHNAIIVFCLKGNENELVSLDSTLVFNTEKEYPRLWDTDKQPADLRDEACAKIEVRNGNITYSIKRNTHGRFLNPIGIYDEFRHMKDLKKTGRAEFRYDPVNKKVFELYLNFLKTKNPAWLINAERESI